MTLNEYGNDGDDEEYDDDIDDADDEGDDYDEDDDKEDGSECSQLVITVRRSAATTQTCDVSQERTWQLFALFRYKDGWMGRQNKDDWMVAKT